MNTQNENKKLQLVEMFEEYVFMDKLPQLLKGAKMARFGCSFTCTGDDIEEDKEKMANFVRGVISKTQSQFAPGSQTIFSMSVDGDSVNILFREVQVESETSYLSYI
jgi:hypothetical protein